MTVPVVPVVPVTRRRWRYQHERDSVPRRGRAEGAWTTPHERDRGPAGGGRRGGRGGGCGRGGGGGGGGGGGAARGRRGAGRAVLLGADAGGVLRAVRRA